MGLCSHMRNFRPAVDDHSPATDTSVYSDALGSPACGDEADAVWGKRVYLLAIDMITASFGNRLGFVSSAKLIRDLGWNALSP